MKMKRWIGLLLSLCLVFALAGCGGSNDNTTGSDDKNDQTEVVQTEDTTAEKTSDPKTDDSATKTGSEGDAADTSNGSNILVVYFSRTGEQYGVGVIDKGNTAIVAEMIAEETGADKFEIFPANDTYPQTYDELTDVAKQELNDNARPEIAGTLPDLTGYDTIFIGAPVWWGDWPMICYTYFEANDFSGKKLVPFSTHAGSGLSGFDKKLEKAAPTAEVLTGLAITGADTQNNPDKVRSDVRSWLSGLGY